MCEVSWNNLYLEVFAFPVYISSGFDHSPEHLEGIEKDLLLVEMVFKQV